MVTRKRPDLSGSRSHFADAAGSQANDDDSGHRVGGREALGGVIEDLDERVPGRGLQHACDIAQGKDQRDCHDKSHGCIQNNRPHYCFWQGG